jgi:hypothetical protein
MVPVPWSGVQPAGAAFRPLLASGFDWNFRLTMLGLIVALLVGALLVAVVRRWRNREGRPLGPTADEQLAQFRTLYEQGEMSEEEFRKVRAVLGGQIRKQLNMPTPPGQQNAPVQDIQTGPAAAPPTSAPEPPPDGIRPA